MNTNGGLWGIPQDTGPMGLLYREDLLGAAGIEPPKTWDDFAAAETYRTKNPKSYLVNVAPSQSGVMVPGRPACAVRIRRQADREGRPRERGVEEGGQVLGGPGEQRAPPPTTPTSMTPGTRAWQRQVRHPAHRRLGAVFLQGTAGKTSASGGRRPAAVGCQPAGVQQLGRLDRCGAEAEQEPDRRLQLALFINTNKESALQFANEQFLFPAMKEILTDPTFLNQESKFFGGQKVNEKFAQISETVGTDFQWLPFMDYVYTNFTETLGKAFADKTDAVAGLQAWQDASAKYAKDQGFTVS